MSDSAVVKPPEPPSCKPAPQSKKSEWTTVVLVVAAVIFAMVFLGAIVYALVTADGGIGIDERIDCILMVAKVIKRKDSQLDELRRQLKILGGQVKNQSLQGQAPGQNISVSMEDGQIGTTGDGPFPYPTGRGNCSGYILLGSGVSNLSYGIPPVGAAHGCAWVARTENEGPIIVRRVSLSGYNGSEQNNSNISLGVAINPVHSVFKTKCNYVSLLTATTISFTEPVVIIFFNGPPGSGFHLELQGGAQKRSPKNMTFVGMMGPFTYRFPPGSGYYTRNQLFALVAIPDQGRAVSLTAKDIDTHSHDWLSLMWWGPENSMKCLSKSGIGGSMSGSGEINYPMVAFFEPDGNIRVYGDYKGFFVVGEFYQ